MFIWLHDYFVNQFKFIIFFFGLKFKTTFEWKQLILIRNRIEDSFLEMAIKSYFKLFIHELESFMSNIVRFI